MDRDASLQTNAVLWRLETNFEKLILRSGNDGRFYNHCEGLLVIDMINVTKSRPSPK